MTAASDGSQHPEVEILVLPGKGKFSGRADCNVLVALDNGPGVLQAARRADLLVASDQIPAAGQLRFFRLDEFRRAWTRWLDDCQAEHGRSAAGSVFNIDPLGDCGLIL